MRLLTFLFLNSVFITAMLIPSPGFSDQSDSRLDNLFSLLKQTENPATLRNTENQIWEIWLQHPNADVERLMLLATQRMNSQHYTEALAVFSQIIKSFPDYAEGWNKRATLHYVVGNLDASVSDIEKTLELEPRHFGALSGLGMVYIQREELSKAKQSFEELIKLHPNSPNAQQNLEFVNERLRLTII
ncbi:MAG: tetratricopeptide repeat protein [Pseudohongiella sp.]|jgi:tetratricopeptide (TPR) repeat protein|nr:tetratricopeptide repeat protein [Pseudohongiella sp.]